MSRIACFRADASNDIGGGHIYRCLTLADTLSNAGWRCVFACKPNARDWVPALTRSGHDLIELDMRAEPLQLVQNLSAGVELLVVDHYGRDTSFESECRPWARRIMVLDDNAGRSHDCDVLLNQNLDAKENNYIDRVPDGCLFLLGPDYALLRPQFLAAQPAAMARRVAGVKAKKLLVSIGATDPKQISSRIVAASAGFPLEIDVVLGTHDIQRHTILDLGGQLGLVVRVHVDVVDMASLMVSADFAVGAAGSTSWERCCLGLPTIMLVLAENQRSIASALHSAGAAYNLGDIESLVDSELKAALERFWQDDDYRLAMARRAAATCDGQGAKRVVGALFNA